MDSASFNISKNYDSTELNYINSQPVKKTELSVVSSVVSTEQMVKSVTNALVNNRVSRSTIPCADGEEMAISEIEIAKLAHSAKTTQTAHREPVFSQTVNSIDSRNVAELGLQLKMDQPTSTKVNQVAISSLSNSEKVSTARQLTAGACKQVWVKDDAPTKAFYTALAGNRSAQRELETEVSTAITIKKNLEKQVLLDFLAKEIMPNLSENQEMDPIGYLSTFESVKAMKEEIISAKAPHPEISDKHLSELQKYFSDDEGRIKAEKAIGRGQNLAIDIRVVSEREKIEGLFTVETAKADGDLEKFIRNTDLYKPADLIDCASQVLNGMADLHKAGFVHGDIKPENVLFTKRGETFHFMISDWGKAQQMTANRSTTHVGNTRFAPWENRLSMAGDVCSTGIKLIRIFEQRVLAHKRIHDPELRSLIKPEHQGGQIAANSREKGGKVREGFEVFVIESQDFNAIEANHSIGQTFLARMKQGLNMIKAPGPDQLQQMGKEKDRYIDALIAGMEEIHFADRITLLNLGQFLKDMTNITIGERLTMEQATEQFEQIKQLLIQN